MSTIELRNVYKDYDTDIRAVTDFNLKINDGEFVVFVGPSGCGKSTILRMVAGLEDITAGEVLIDDEIVNDTHPKDRDIAMVFQNYALYPHMTVAENLSFGLKMKNVSEDEIKRRTAQAAEMIGLAPYMDRLPRELSGGQSQRVALGRAIVRQPKAFLMDEPLSNLDAKLRTKTRAELIELSKDLQVTTIYVTHDQIEAMTMADRIVIINFGVTQQIGTPREVYMRPNNKFVAGFIGSPPMNLINVTVREEGLELDERLFKAPESILKALFLSGYGNKVVTLGVRPEHINLYEDSDPEIRPYSFKVNLRLAEMLGSETLLHFNLHGEDVVSKINTLDEFERDEEVHFCINFEHVHFFDDDTEERIKLVDEANPLSNSTDE